MHSTVFLPMIERGRASSILRSWAPRAPRASTEISMPGAMAPPIHSPRAGDGVEGGRRAEVDDDARGAVQVHGGQRVDDPVGADLLRVVHQHRHPGLDPRLDDEGRDVAVVAADHVAHLVQHGRDGGTDRDPVHAGLPDQRVVGHQALEEHGVLVGGPARIGRDPPVLDDLGALEQAKYRMGIADVDGQTA
jgi:hypothetical protein